MRETADHNIELIETLIYMESIKPNDKRLYYRYILNENSARESVVLHKIPLTKKHWYRTNMPLDVLTSYIRTKGNPKGFIDFESFAPSKSNEVIKSSKEIFETEPPKYTRDEIGTMTRDELVKLAELWNIDYSRKKASFLRKAIVAKQREYLERLAQTKSEVSD